MGCARVCSRPHVVSRLAGLLHIDLLGAAALTSIVPWAASEDQKTLHDAAEDAAAVSIRPIARRGWQAVLQRGWYDELHPLTSHIGVQSRCQRQTQIAPTVIVHVTEAISELENDKWDIWTTARNKKGER